MSDGTTTSPWGEPAAPDAEPGPDEPAPSDAGWTDDHPDQGPYVRYYPPQREVGIRRILRITKATVGLAIIALGLGLVLAAALGAIVWAIAAAIHHAASA